MAQRVITTLVDDIDGTEAAETISFAVEGKSYEIDLSEKEREGAPQEPGALDPAGTGFR